MNSVELRSLMLENLPAIVELDRLCFGQLWTAEGYQRELLSPNSVLLGLVPVPQPPIDPPDLPETLWRLPSQLLGLGCFWAILEEAHITIVAVHPDYRAQGLGQALLFSLLKVARDCALERATLEVRASNQAAVRLYEKFGFAVAGRRRRYYKDPEEDALILWRGGLHQPEFEQQLSHWQAEIRDRLSHHCWQLNEDPLTDNRPPV
ncbi:MAG: ribosomal protein S18-alanine N-acetyltransferase [Desertifilum sp. SIO1I2]|nr:ribosomal protein S18-alanine N-acetyltransferase [Desertifilum sp. SIO1I2]